MTIEVLKRIYDNFGDYRIIFENYYLPPTVTHFTRILDVLIRPDLKEVRIRLGEDDTDVDHL